MSEITDKLRHLVSLDKPESGGPYGGYAAAQCVKAMAEAADYIDRLEARVAMLEAAVRADVELIDEYQRAWGKDVASHPGINAARIAFYRTRVALTPVAETPNQDGKI